MTSSDADNLPRHKSFFFNRNRLNVAISRAQNVAVVLFNPNLLLASANTIEEMKLMNNFCKLLKFNINKKMSNHNKIRPVDKNNLTGKYKILFSTPQTKNTNIPKSLEVCKFIIINH